VVVESESGVVPRPRRRRRIRFNPTNTYFKPRGIPLSELEEVVLELDELEALRLHDVEGLDQVQAAEKMQISQPTFARVLDKAYKKIADSLVHSKAIRLTSQAG
jgi:predicted DNA-binding protein (UPF0251 family)